MARKKLPIGIQTFAEIRREGYYYVDKTPFVASLAESGKYYFLSRPRRFGKSLFLDTLAEAFAGNRTLFTGLYLENHWDWERRHPVVRISFAEGQLQSRAELERSIRRQLRENAQRLAVPLTDPEDVTGSFAELITRAAEAHGQRSVVLVDEYDKPILDNLTRPEIAAEMREGLRNLYSVLKGRDADLRFVFLTGVSKFSKKSPLDSVWPLQYRPRHGTLPPSYPCLGCWRGRGHPRPGHRPFQVPHQGLHDQRRGVVAPSRTKAPPTAPGAGRGAPRPGAHNLV